MLNQWSYVGFFSLNKLKKNVCLCVCVCTPLPIWPVVPCSRELDFQCVADISRGTVKSEKWLAQSVNTTGKISLKFSCHRRGVSHFLSGTKDSPCVEGRGESTEGLENRHTY